MMTTRTAYILWHILLPVSLFLCLVYVLSSLDSAASEWREHGKWECDTTPTYLYCGKIGRVGLYTELIYAITSTFYQPAARFARGRLVLRLLCRFRVCR